MAVADLADLVDLDPRDQVAVVRRLRPADDRIDALERSLVAGGDDLRVKLGGGRLGVAGPQRGLQPLDDGGVVVGVRQGIGPATKMS
jgi:hypothetical protein